MHRFISTDCRFVIKYCNNFEFNITRKTQFEFKSYFKQKKHNSAKSDTILLIALTIGKNKIADSATVSVYRIYKLAPTALMRADRA